MDVFISFSVKERVAMDACAPPLQGMHKVPESVHRWSIGIKHLQYLRDSYRYRVIYDETIGAK